MKTTRLFTALLLTCLMFAMAPPYGAQSSAALPAPMSLVESTFGYTVESQSLGSNWIEIGATGIEIDFDLAADDEMSSAIGLPFSFPYFERSYGAITVSTNGFIAVGDPVALPEEWNAPIPVDDPPNNIIAVLWDDLIVYNEVYPDGKVYFQFGGSAPSRFVVIEWVNVLLRGSGTNTPITFEAVLYENGDIAFNYKTLTSDIDAATVGIEDAEGVDGLQYLYNEPGLASDSRLFFRYPETGPRVKAFPKYLGEFLSNRFVDFAITVRNTGTVLDTYNLTTEIVQGELVAEISFRDGSLAPLTDTNSDGIVDTGPVSPGADREVILRLISGEGAPVGDFLFLKVYATSSVDPGKQFFVYRDTAVPAQFAHAINNPDTGTNVLFSLPTNQILEQPTDTILPTIPALVRVSRYVYLLGWERAITSNISNIEYLTLDYLSRHVSPLRTLHDNTLVGTERWKDVTPVISSTSDGQIGVLYIRKKYNPTQGNNENVMFALLDSNGDLIREISITNNPAYGFNQAVGINFFAYPALTATSGNKFFLSWEKTRWIQVSETETKATIDIYMAVLDSNGNFIVQPTQLTESEVDNRHYHEPVLTSTLDGGAYLVFSAYDNSLQKYQLGDIKFNSSFHEDFRGLVDNWAGTKPDVMQLKGGRILLAWSNLETNQISYNTADTTSIPFTYFEQIDLDTPTGLTADYVSVTQDPNGNGVITWGDRQKDFLFYTLVTPLGNPVTPPMMFNHGVIPEASLFFNGNMASAPLDGTVKNVIPLIGW